MAAVGAPSMLMPLLCTAMLICSLDFVSSVEFTWLITMSAATPHLVVIDLSINSITGVIPDSISSCSSLEVIRLRNNSIEGEIPPALAHCSSLQEIVLSNNKLNGTIPPGIGLLHDLTFLFLPSNKLEGSIPSSLGRSPSLSILVLRNNSLSGEMPPLLANSSSLYYLDLMRNNLNGEIPSTLFDSPSLATLDLSYNEFSGPIPDFSLTASKLKYLSLTENNISGEIPPTLGNFSALCSLLLAQNKLQGSIPESLTRIQSLQALDLAYNYLSGAVPPALYTVASLTYLGLGVNQLAGRIPTDIAYTLPNIETLVMEGNHFDGPLPASLVNASNLQVLELRDNSFTGLIPSFWSLPYLTQLDLGANQFGEVDWSSLCSVPASAQLKAMYLDNNQIHGTIPSTIGNLPSSLQLLYLSENRFTGMIPSEIGKLTNLTVLQFARNLLSGGIPDTIGNLRNLFLLEVNFLHGSIPESFMSLRGINEMDLSQNNLSGEIPDFLGTFSSLQLLNLSFNSLEGIVPTGGAFINSSKVFIQGNKDLCTRSAMPQLPLCTSTRNKRRETLHIICIVFALASVVTVLVSVAATILLKKRNKSKQHTDESPNELMKFSYAELARATNDFSLANLVGSGSFGVVYKGIFEFQMHPVAIKVFKLDNNGAPMNFLTECEVLRNTRHRNLMRVISLCSSCDKMGNEFKALVLDYMPNGNLEGWLHSEVHKQRQRRPLSLGSRIMIAMDIAAALDYLHNWCTPPLVHCDLKPSNVLLDDAMGAHVSDYGLAKFLCTNPSVSEKDLTSAHGPRGSVGYIAPEYGMGCKISTAGDVYSYGVILLEMLTGKHPTDDIFKDGLNLHGLVVSAFPQDICDILETSIIPYYELEEANHRLDGEDRLVVGMQNCIMQFAKLGLECSMDSPSDRPAMQDVYAEITMIKETFLTLHC
uniref:Receptor kinase-like protein Xa21 n=2 Tax=Aegilops tauschii TaxID=37682 RepID=M8BYQ0_AEGTA